MKPAAVDPSRLDVAAFAKAHAELEGRLPMARAQRLGSSTVAPADGEAGEVTWSVKGFWRQPAGGEAEIRLHLVAHATVHLTCQRCLQPMAQPLEVDRTVRFVPGEEYAAQLDEESDEDVLALPRTLDLPALVEDELILALPIVPMHEACPQPLAYDGEAGTDVAEDGAERPNPFAALAALKSRG